MVGSLSLTVTVSTLLPYLQTTFTEENGKLVKRQVGATNNCTITSEISEDGTFIEVGVETNKHVDPKQEAARHKPMIVATRPSNV